MAFSVPRRISGVLVAMLATMLVASACGGSPDGDASEDNGSQGDGSEGDGSEDNGSSGSGSSGSGDEPDAPGAAGGPNGGGSGSGGSEVEPSAGCDGASALSSGEQSIEVDGVTRTFIVDLPSDYDESTPHPLLFGFHGRGFSAAEFRSPAYGDLLSVAGDEAIVVHPDALGEPERAWDIESLDDVRFFDALLEELTDGLCIDESRVFAAGHSSGGYFINLLGCVRGDELRAIAPVAGGGPFGDDGDAPSCDGPVSAWIAHAEDDETVLFENGENSRDYWLESGSCDASFDDVTPSPCVAYEGCGAGLAVNWCVYDGGHDWPSFAPRGIWSFFEQF